MRALALALLGACGRLDFGAVAREDAAGGDATGSASYEATILADHPLLYYRLDESSGPAAVDRSGHGNDGMYTINGGVIAFARAGAIHGDPDVAVVTAARTPSLSSRAT